MEGYISENQWVDLSVLPRTNRMNQIDWAKSINFIMDFKYNSICGKIKILEKIGSSEYKVAFYVDDNIIEYTFQPDSIKKCRFSNVFKQPIIITNPELAKYFINKDDLYRYTAKSSRLIKAKCPVCGFEKMIEIRTLTAQGFACPACSDGISYPNKFMFNILSQLKIDFLKEVNNHTFGFEWVKGCKYDFYFEAGCHKYFIEMDGGFHYGNGFVPYEKSHAIDEMKNNLALQHNINIIRINCNYKGMSNRFDFIKNNILISELSNILDLSRVNWENANVISMESDIKLAAKMWNTTSLCVQEIADKLGLCACTTRRYLKMASKLKLCDYNSTDSSKRTRDNNLKKMIENSSGTHKGVCRPIALYKDQQLIGVFFNQAELSRQSEQVCGRYIPLKYISRVCVGERKSIYGFTINRIDKEEYSKIKQYKIN